MLRGSTMIATAVLVVALMMFGDNYSLRLGTTFAM